MSSVQSECECPKCGYERGDYEYVCKVGNEYFNCCQCGYSLTITFNEEKSRVPDNIVWDHDEEGGVGSYNYEVKDCPGGIIGPVCDDTVKELEQNLDKFDVCQYTFQKDGHWFIRDLVNNREMAFTYKSFWQKN